MKPRERPPMGLYICRKPPWDCMFIGSPKKVPVGFYIGGIQQLRGQEEGEGGQPKVHACWLAGSSAFILGFCPCGQRGGGM
jgi:hypothetical protein